MIFDTENIANELLEKYHLTDIKAEVTHNKINVGVSVKNPEITVVISFPRTTTDKRITLSARLYENPVDIHRQIILSSIAAYFRNTDPIGVLRSDQVERNKFIMSINTCLPMTADTSAIFDTTNKLIAEGKDIVGKDSYISSSILLNKEPPSRKLGLLIIEDLFASKFMSGIRSIVDSSSLGMDSWGIDSFLEENINISKNNHPKKRKKIIPMQDFYEQLVRENEHQKAKK